MKTLEELYKRAAELKDKNRFYVDRLGRASLINHIACLSEVMLSALYYLGAGVCEGGELDRVGLALIWFSVMFETSPEIIVTALSIDDGFMLRAIIEPDAKLERDGETATARKTFYTRQLFFYNDSRSLTQARSLCERRAVELVDAVFEADNEKN